jgi:DNA-binding NarL/FixJ family response regulator
VLVLQMTAAVLLGTAAVGFTLRAGHRREPLLVWLGPAVTLGASRASTNFLFPSVYSEWLYTGDLLRLGFYVVLLGAGAAQIAADQRHAAALEERRRVARNLHDGLAHELAFIATRARALAAESSDPAATQVAAAAERALNESRDAIAALSAPVGEPLDAALARGGRCRTASRGSGLAWPRERARRLAGHERRPSPHRPRGGVQRRPARQGGIGPCQRDEERRPFARARHRRRRGVRPDAKRPRLRPDGDARAGTRAGRRGDGDVAAGRGDGDRGGRPLSEPILRVLVADDHPAVRDGVSAALEGHGFVVCAEASDAASAVAGARRERPDLCLVDVNTPGGGIRAAAEISAAHPDTVVVMLTVSRDDDDLFAALRAGASGYLLKDVDPARLPHALRGVFAGEAALPRTLVHRLMDEFRDRQRRRQLPLLRHRGVELSDREWQVLERLSDRKTTQQIASDLEISAVTVRRHVSTILKKLRVSTRDEAVRLLGADDHAEPPGDLRPRR